MHRFLTEPGIAAYAQLFGATVVKAAVDDVLREARGSAASGVPPFEVLAARARGRLDAHDDGALVALFNATGVLLHTNLGRAPLGASALAAAARVGGGYSNLEFDVADGTRGSRHARVVPLLRELTGAEGALVVNNCAAAVLLVLDTFAKGREVVVARNQLVEIGGGFRLPDVLARSGAVLVEAGATNKVYLRDIERALSVHTALLLRSHPSNYRIDGFTADVAPRDLAALARRVGVTSVEDLGGGALVDLAPYGLPHERTVGEAVGDGIDLVTFSGDKLLGGPQAGIIVGTTAAIARLRANPLLRALRVDKLTLAALEATLRCYRSPAELAAIPFFAMLGASLVDLERRARALASRVGPEAVAVATEAFAGGGAAPLSPLASFGVAVRSGEVPASALAARLRAGRPRIVARVAEDRVLLDMRTLPAEHDGAIGAALLAALA